MEIKEAKEIINAGMAWANWTEEQKEALKVALRTMTQVEELRKEIWELNKEIGGYAGTVEALTEEFQMLTGRMKILKDNMFNPK